MKTLIAACLIAAAAAASAHDPLPSAQWCSTGTIVDAGSFTFTGPAVSAYADCLRSGGCPDPVAAGLFCSVRSCGNFDDDYGVATRMVHGYCHALQPGSAIAGSDFGTVRPVVFTPNAYNSLKHHRDYGARLGVAGVCARCDPPTVQPPAN